MPLTAPSLGSYPTPQAVAVRTLALLALAIAATCLFPESVGLRTIQEGLRALPALEMHAAGEPILPTLHGEPYLAKPPLIYWLTLGVMNTLGAIATEPAVTLALRLTCALAGAITIPLTYLAGRRILRPDNATEADSAHADLAAFLAACCLLAGPLHLHQSRTAEIDILTSPLTVLGVWAAVEMARRGTRKSNLVRTHAAAAGFTAAAAALALAKGPPGALVLLIAALGGPLLAAGAAATTRIPKLGIAAAALACLGVGAGFITANARTGEPIELRGIAGALIAVTLLAITVLALARAAADPNARRTLLADARVRFAVPLAAVGLIPFVLWYRAAAARATSDAVEANATTDANLNQQTGENLIFFLPSAPAEYAEAAAYAAGPGSVAAIIALLWLVKDRPWRALTGGDPLSQRETVFAPAHFTALAWALGPILVFGLLGRGTPRYITAAWPGVALLGGLWLAAAARDFGPAAARVIKTDVPAVGALAAAAFAAFWARPPAALASQSPRELITAAAERHPDAAIATWEMWTPLIDVYAHDAGVPVLGHFAVSRLGQGRIPGAGLAPAAGMGGDSQPPSPVLVLLRSPGDTPEPNPGELRAISAILRGWTPDLLTDLPPWRVSGGDAVAAPVLFTPPPPSTE